MVSGAPRSTLAEQDNSSYWTEESGLGVYMALAADAGPIGIHRCATVGDLKRKYTTNGKITASHGIDYQVAKRLCNTPGLELFIGRVLGDNALYGGCVVPCGNAEDAHALSSGLADPNDYTFKTGTGDSFETATIAFRSDVNANYGGTAFYLPGRKAAVTFEISGDCETEHIYPQADDNKSLEGKFFKLPNNLGYVWFKIDDSSIDPGAEGATKSLIGLTGYPIVFEANATKATILDAINSLLTGEGFNTITVREELPDLEQEAEETPEEFMLRKKNDDAANIVITLKASGPVDAGSQGNTGWQFIISKSGANSVDAMSAGAVDCTLVKAVIVRNSGPIAIGNAVVAALANFAGYEVSLATVEKDDEVPDSEEAAVLSAKYLTAGPAENASVHEYYPAPVVVTTTTQGSKSAGTDAVLFYYNNPSEKANTYGIRLYNHEDYPDKAAEPGTFLVEVYTKQNVKAPESTVLCSRDRNAVDDYGRSMFVEDVMANLTGICASSNPALDPLELPRSIGSSDPILWFGGGDSGTLPKGTALINKYTELCKPLEDKEDYAVSLLLPGGYYASPYLQELDRIAQKRGEAAHICGCPLEYETISDDQRMLDAMDRWVNNEALITSSYSSMFSPHLYAYDDDNGRTYALPAECCVAEQIAFANENYSISEPILGFARGTLQQVQGIARRYTFTDDGQGTGDKLYDMRINPIRKFRNQGYVIWGQKTLQRSASKRDRLNVRLMLIALKPLLNQIQMSTIGELPTPTTKKRLEGQLRTVMNVGVGRNWFKPNYNLTIESDPVYEQQHIQRIFYEIEPYDAIEYVQGYIVITNGTVTEITQA